MGKITSKEIKEEIINKVKQGQRVKDLSDQYGIKVPTIYGFLKDRASGDSTLIELSRLKRENEALKSLIGKLVYEQELSKKKGYKL